MPADGQQRTSNGQRQYYDAGSRRWLPMSGAPPTNTSDTSGVRLPLRLEPIGGGNGMLVDADGDPVVGDDGMPIIRSMETGGTGAIGRTQFASEAAVDAAQARLANANARLAELDALGRTPITPYQQAQLDFQRQQLELQKLQAENDVKELLYSEFGATKRSLIAEKGATQRTLMGLGPDPFLQGAYLGGNVARGVTPQETTVMGAQKFLNAPMPTASMDMSVAQLESALGQISSLQPPAIGGFGVGMARGGVIDMERGNDGAFSMKEARLVGDGGGIIPGVTEVMTVEKGPFGIKSVEITPLTGGAETGTQISALSNLAPLYEDFSFPLIPQATVRGKQGVGGVWGKTLPFNMQALGAMREMGYQPGLVSFGGPKVYYRDPQSGTYKHIASRDVFEKSGFRWQDVMHFAPEAGKGAFTYGGEMTAPIAPGAIQPSGGAGPLVTPVINALSGALLPAPIKVAGILTRWKSEGDPRYELALQAYASALNPMTGLPITGLSAQAIESMVSRVTPEQGAFGRRIGWTGGYS